MWKLAEHILKSYGFEALISIVLLLGVYKLLIVAFKFFETFINKYHDQAMKKLDEVITSNHEIKETIAIHGVKIEFIEDLKKWNEKQDGKIDGLSKEIQKVQKQIISKETIKLLIEACK